MPSLRRRLVRRGSPDNLDVRVPTTWAFQFEDEVTGLDFVDEITKPPVAVGTPDLHLLSRYHTSRAASPNHATQKISVHRDSRSSTVPPQTI